MGDQSRPSVPARQRAAQYSLFLSSLAQYMFDHDAPLTQRQHWSMSRILNSADEIPGNFEAKEDCESARVVIQDVIAEVLHKVSCPLSLKQERLLRDYLEKKYPLKSGYVYDEMKFAPREVMHLLVQHT